MSLGLTEIGIMKSRFTGLRCVPVLIVVLAFLFTACDAKSRSGPATRFLNAYEKVVRNYEAKAAGSGRVTLSEINSMNADVAEMAVKVKQFIDKKKGGMSSAERKRYAELSARFSKAVMTLSQKVTVSP
jgi:hypothetical protein